MFSRLATFIIAAVVSVPTVTAICNGDGFGISADHHPTDTTHESKWMFIKLLTRTHGVWYNPVDVYHPDCHLYETLNFATDQAACTSGILGCGGANGSPYSGYTDTATNTTSVLLSCLMENILTNKQLQIHVPLWNQRRCLQWSRHRRLCESYNLLSSKYIDPHTVQCHNN